MNIISCCGRELFNTWCFVMATQHLPLLLSNFFPFFLHPPFHLFHSCHILLHLSTRHTELKAIGYMWGKNLWWNLSFPFRVSRREKTLQRIRTYKNLTDKKSTLTIEKYESLDPLKAFYSRLFGFELKTMFFILQSNHTFWKSPKMSRQLRGRMSNWLATCLVIRTHKLFGGKTMGSYQSTE